MRLLPFTLLVLLLLSARPYPCLAVTGHEAQLANLIDEMVSEHGFESVQLEALFSQVKYSPSVLEAMARPAEAKPWHQYRPIFITDARISEGAEFYQTHKDLLAVAAARYGVPAGIIVAIIGVETFYGKYKGKHKVIDSLTTLAFGHETRGTFFYNELREFLLLTRAEGIDPLSLSGSYAGAMGVPQFIPSSFRAYAVDFNEDGRRDLWGDPADVVGSVANYLARHGWRDGEPITRECSIESLQHTVLLDSGIKPHIALERVEQLGVRPKQELSGNPRVALIMLDMPGRQECWLGLTNFYVITRYNHSALYAMVVFQLAQEIERRVPPQVQPELE